jgi:hypothetical protein
MGLQFFKSLEGTRKLISKRTYLHGGQVDLGCWWRPQVLSEQKSVSPRVSNTRKIDGKYSIFYYLASSHTITSANVCAQQEDRLTDRL